jgi:threonine aldolase
LAKQRGLRMHLDGARLFNASIASGIEAREYARYFDSVSFCLSKGLGCPVGSLITGSARLIDSVHRFRKMYGGGMRQAGILAAAGIYALDHNVARLEQDHSNAKKLAQALHTIRGISIDPEEIETNILIFDVSGTGLCAQDIVTRLQKEKVLMLAVSKTSIRAVTHLDVKEEDIGQAIAVIHRVFS